MGEFAKAQVPEEIVANQLAHKVAVAVPDAMGQLGIEATVRRRFISGPFVVLHVHLSESSRQTYLQEQIGSERSAYVDAWLRRFGAKRFVEESLSLRAAQQLIHTLPKELKSKLKEIGFEVQIIAKLQSEESHFFFDVINDESEEMHIESGRKVHADGG